MTIAKPFIFSIALALIVGAIWYLEAIKPSQSPPAQSVEIKPNLQTEEIAEATLIFVSSTQAKANQKKTLSKTTAPARPRLDRGAVIQAKMKQYPLAKEIVQPAGFVNINSINIQDLIGKKVVLVDFWTYSCINCQRTLPYLNGWYDKYKDQGLIIVGVHTPEFKFEQEYDNVSRAVKKFALKYPVVLDNNYGTWRAYGNRYWPRKYLIDIDGFIVYDHIGEGAYAQTEEKIQAALAERASALNLKPMGKTAMLLPLNPPVVNFQEINSPEVYFGAARNEYLANGQKGVIGKQDLIQAKTSRLNQLYLVGTWDIQDEFARNQTLSAKIIFRYSAKDVYFVGSAEAPVRIKVRRDGQLLGQVAGEDIDKKTSTVLVQEDRLYKLINDAGGAGEHTLEMIIESSGLKAFTFTFG